MANFLEYQWCLITLDGGMMVDELHFDTLAELLEWQGSHPIEDRQQDRIGLMRREDHASVYAFPTLGLFDGFFWDGDNQTTHRVPRNYQRELKAALQTA